eukprot:g3554.t2
MCLPAVPTPSAPAILAYQLSDLFSLVICGYIGGRCVQLKYPEPLYGNLWLHGLLSALVTAFGGGTGYVLLMSRPGCRRFGWQDPWALLASFVGLLGASYAVRGCEASFAHCDEAFRFFDCASWPIAVVPPEGRKAVAVAVAVASQKPVAPRELGPTPNLPRAAGATRGFEANEADLARSNPDMPGILEAGRKLTSERLDFLQLEQRSTAGSQEGEGIWAKGWEHRSRMESYRSLRHTIEQLGGKANPGEGAGLGIYVESVKNLLNNSMVQAIRSQFAADKTILQNAISGFDLCNSTLFGALAHPNAVRDGGHGGLYKGLAALKVRHNECRGRQEAKKKEYDMCMDLKVNQKELMNASCDGNFSKFYNKVGSQTTGQWEATCDSKQVTYRQSPPSELPLVHQRGNP